MRTYLACLLGLSWVAACGSDSADSKFPDDGGSSSGGEAGASSSGGFPLGDGGTSGSSGDGGRVLTTDVYATVTADNAFSFGYGDQSGLSTFIQGAGSDGSAIFNCPVGFGPHAFLVPGASAPSSAYLYIVAWADQSTTQGTLAQFSRAGGAPVYSGSEAWEVCAVGDEYDDQGPGPDQATVGTKIGECNAGAATVASRGWVNSAGALTAGALGKLARGEANDANEGNFPLVCQDADGGAWEDGGASTADAGLQAMSALAQWMWFDPADGESPFVGNAANRTKSFLIFRLPATALPSPVN